MHVHYNSGTGHVICGTFRAVFKVDNLSLAA